MKITIPIGKIGTGVDFAAFSPDGKHVLSVGPPSSPLEWDLDPGSLAREITGITAGYPIAFSPDRHQIASTSLGSGSLAGYSVLNLWDTVSGTLIRRVEMDVEDRSFNTGRLRSHRTEAASWSAVAAAMPCGLSTSATAR
jgi:WD40 repeat protein